MRPSLTVERYLRQELDARHTGSKLGFEYVAGERFAMSPISPRADTITFNIRRHLHRAVAAASCRMFGDILTRIADDCYYYPDVVITCAPPGPADIIVAPSFVVEVTSPSTRSTDLREKPIAYRACQTLTGFLIVEQRRRHVLAFARREDGGWDRTELTGTGSIDIPCIGAGLTLDQIYETLDFPARVREDEFTAAEYGRDWVLVPAEAVS
jgi:Uma2 family endonuclease